MRCCRRTGSSPGRGGGATLAGPRGRSPRGGSVGGGPVRSAGGCHGAEGVGREVVLDRPEDRDRPLRAVGGEDREGGAFDRVDRAVEGADAEAGGGGAAAAHGADDRQLLVGDRLARLVVGAEEAAPLGRADVADLV